MKRSAISTTEPNWHVIDAKDVVLGRFCTRVADLLRGKYKVAFVPYMDCGDHVVIINASQVKLTGNKLRDKTYYHHSAYPGGLKSELLSSILRTSPERIVQMSVKGMLPKNKLQNEWMKRLHVYAGVVHPHGANLANVTAS